MIQGVANIGTCGQIQAGRVLIVPNCLQPVTASFGHLAGMQSAARVVEQPGGHHHERQRDPDRDEQPASHGHQTKSLFLKISIASISTMSE